MVRRFFKSIALTATAVVLLAALAAAITNYFIYERGLHRELRQEAAYLCAALDWSGGQAERLESLASENRITLIAQDGEVLYDSELNASGMGNHASRPEVAQALAQGWGESERLSESLSEKTLYCARKTSAGDVLRVGRTLRSVYGALAEMLPLVAGLLSGVILISLLIARREAKKIVAPINGLDLEHPLENETYAELSPLLKRMERQRVQLKEHVRALEDAHAELKTILDNMREGMILLDSDEHILSVNGSAREIFHIADKNPEGKNLLAVCRDAELYALAKAAIAGENGDMEANYGERRCRICASPVLSGGAVLMILDVTEAYEAEAIRREFTANVSHELKTPLTAISGFAEIIRDGIAQAEDVPRFAEMISKEAARLTALVNDILELSRLDERRNLGQWERVELLEMLRALIQDFVHVAQQKEQRLLLDGEPAQVEGYPLLLREMFFNLIDNAVKYTPNGGTITLSVRKEGGRTACEVADTGIGIPLEHQARVFERFYRVEKSHSRATGGTGLGLAIVKHVAQIHHAQVTLISAEGRGTAITVRFPETDAGRSTQTY